MTQTRNGKALEYAFLQSLDNRLNEVTETYITESSQLNTAREAYFSFEEGRRHEMNLAADAGNNVILRLEPQLQNGTDPLQLSIQQDAAGQEGDVRDVLAVRNGDDWEMGISCKNNHAALKHSRVSATIDVGESWFGYPSTQAYFNEVTPIFQELGQLRTQEVQWRDISDKQTKYYVPILEALVRELRRLDEAHPGEIPRRLLGYLLGRTDFYKAITDTRRRLTEVQGFNLYSTLNKNAGTRTPQLKMPQLKLPTRFYDIHFKNNSNTTIMIVCDEGWTVSARIHSAASLVENSLKLDVKLAGLPPTLYRHTESWD